MPKTVAQWTGLAVTGIIVFGCDLDVIYALPLGLMAGTAAAVLIDLDELFRASRLRPARIEWQPQTRRRPEH